jgi:hypothetical protein
MKTPVKNQIKSKGMIAGYGLIGFGVYLIIDGKSTEGFQSIGLGLGIIGIRDAV